VPGSGAGAIYHHATGTFGSTLEAGTAAGLVTAKAALAAGGLMQMGPGTEGIPLLAGWGIIQLSRVDALGRLFISRVNMTDGSDPTKVMSWDLSAITTATTRTTVAPNYGGLLLLPATLGNAGEFLRSGGAGVQPTWSAAAGTSTLLDGTLHTDTVAQAASQGSLILGTAAAKWDELVIGAADTVLTSNGTTAAWSANPAVQHDTLAHLKPFQVAGNVTMNNGSFVVTDALTSGRFANVRVGDRMNFATAGTYHPSMFGFRATTSGVTDANNITMDRSNGSGANITGATATVYPNDHVDNTLLTGYIHGGGIGTWDNGAGTIEQRYGSFVHSGYTSGAAPLMQYPGGTSTGSVSGLSLGHPGHANRAWFPTDALTGDRYFKFPNSSGIILTDTSASSSVTNKTLTTTNKFIMDGVGGNCKFESGGGAGPLDFDLSNLTALRAPKFEDLTPQGQIEHAYVARVTGIDGKAVATTNLFTVPAGKSFITTRVVVRCTAATAITIWPTYGVGVAAGEDDIIASTAHAIAGAANTYIAQGTKDGAVVATAAQVIKLGIDAGATGTSMTLAVDIQGYLV
jgi:hypothetical protein